MFSNLMLSAMILLTSSEVDPNQNLFDKGWTEGNLYQIQGIVDVLGTVSCWVISIVGFGIVIFSIIKNALSGLYVVNPPFWDKVSEIKQSAVNGAQGTITAVTTAGNYKGNAGVQKLGTFLNWLLGLIPNVKDLTDFENDAPIDKKQYFLKSIPLLIAQIFIGMMIFYGYPSKIANWVGTAGTTALSRVLENADPEELLTTISDKLTPYYLTTDGSTDPAEKNINGMAREMMGTIQTRYNDIHTSNVQDIAYNLESLLIAKCTSQAVQNALKGDGYTISYGTSIQGTVPTASDAFKQLGEGIFQAQATNGTQSFRLSIPCSQLLTSEHSTKLGDSDYLVWTITATPVSVANISSASVIVVGGLSPTPQVSGQTFSIPLAEFTVGSGDADLHGTLGRSVVCEVIQSGTGTVKTTFNAVLQSTSVQQTSGAIPILTFAASDRTSFGEYFGTGSDNYLRVNLVGDWSYTVGAGTSSTTTVRITELRLKPGHNLQFILSTWPEASLSNLNGVSALSIDVLRQTSATGN